MISRKCDVCGEFYEIYNTKNDSHKTNGVMLLNIDEKGEYFSHKPIDLCENCMDKMRGFLTNIGE